MQKTQSMFTDWVSIKRYNDTQYTVSLEPALLKTLSIWSDLEYLTVHIEDKALYIRLEPNNKSKNAKPIKVTNYVTGEKSDRTKPLEVLYTFKNQRTASLYEPLIADKTFRARDFCSCKRLSDRTLLDMPYIAVKLSNEYEPWEVGWCVK